MRAWLQWWFRFFTQVAVWPRDLPVLVGAFLHRKRWKPPPEVWAKVDAVHGFMSLRECGLLYRAAHYWPAAGPVIELGSYKGRSTTLLALAGRQVHSVDAWNPATYEHSTLGAFYIPDDAALNDFRNNVRQAGVESAVTVNRGYTTEVAKSWQTTCAILFIDAGHNYPDVRADIVAWLPHLAPDGLLLLHDTFSDRYKGVVRGAGELLKDGWEIVASAGTIVGLARTATARKVTPAYFGVN